MACHALRRAISSLADAVLSSGRDSRGQQASAATCVVTRHQPAVRTPPPSQFLKPPPHTSLHRRRPPPFLIVPPHQLSESVMELDVSGLVLSMCVRINQPFIDEIGVSRVLFADEVNKQQPRPPAAVKPVAYRPFIERAEQSAEPAAGGRSPGSPLEEDDVVEERHAWFNSIVASSEVQKNVLPELLRVEECIER